MPPNIIFSFELRATCSLPATATACTFTFTAAAASWNRDMSIMTFLHGDHTLEALCTNILQLSFCAVFLVEFLRQARHISCQRISTLTWLPISSQHHLEFHPCFVWQVVARP